MSEVIVLGGYGRVGNLCVRELLETTKARVVVAGRNVQRAQSVALSFGERASGAYLDARDPRTFADQIENASLIVCCSAGEPLAALDAAVNARTPFLCLTPLWLDRRALQTIAERAWQVSLPIVLNAGAVPGLPGVLAEQFVRQFESLDEIRLASTGPWSETASARSDLETLRSLWKPELDHGSRRGRSPWEFPKPIGRRFVRLAQSLDLEGFRETHLVRHLTYLEIDDRLLARGADRLLQRDRSSGFCLTAEAFSGPDEAEPAASITIGAADAAVAAAVTAGVLARAILTERVPAGLQSPRDAMNPGLQLDALAKRGLRVIRSS